MIIGLINLLIYLLVIGLILALVFWVIQTIPIPAPFANMIKVVAVVIACLIVIILLLQLVGGVGGDLRLPRVAS